MKILTGLIAFLMMLKVGFAQQPNLAPLGGSAPQSFTLAPDKLGDVSSSVNLFTGDLTFPINLVSLPGRNGLDVSAAIAYSSNVNRQANTWNTEAPTGVVGLGWSFDYPKIVVDNKMTGTREDDTYYVVEGGSSNKLIYIGGTASSGKKYATKNYQFWTITFYPNDEKWEVVKEDGTKFIYGDKNSGRSTVQWIVTWNNWIGSSNVTNSSIQKQQGLVWNLSEIINLWGEKIRYSYLNINQKVGGTAGKEHTEASYLSTITDVFGRTVNFVYGNKSSQEYQEPHTENGTNQIDAYQERYETKFLDYINVNDSDGALLYKVDLDYSTMGTGDMTKRLLTSVTQYNAFNQALPGHTFQYNTTYSPTINFGALTAITTPTGGVVNYTYAQQTLTRAVREKKVTAISGYAEPKVWIGADYVVVSRRQLSGSSHVATGRNVKIQVFSWDGEWLEWDLNENLPSITVSQKNSSGDWVSGNFSDNTKYKHQDFHVTLQRDFFAVLYKTTSTNVYALRIYRRNENQRGGWTKFENTNINLAQNILQEANLVSGENFVAVASKRTNIHVYKWNGTTWTASTITRNTGSSDHNPIVAGHNFIISHKRYYATGFPINVVPDDIKFYFFNEDGSIVTRTAPTFSDTYTDDKSYWYTAASFAVVMADDNPEYFYVWDENYNLQRKSLGYGLTDNSYVSITDNSMVTIVHWNVSENYAARYNGENFIISPNLDASLVSSIMPNPFTFGEDFLLRPKSGSNQQVGLTYFNPNNNTWNNINYNTVNKTSARAGYNFFVKAHATDNSKADIVYRRPNGSFSVDLTSPTIQNLHTNNARFPWQVGNNFIVKNRGVNDGQTFLGEIQSVFFQNGKIDPLKTNFTTGTGFNLSGENPAMHWVGDYDHTFNLVGGNVIVAFLNAFYQFDATEVKLFKLIDQAANGPLTDFAVQKVSVNDGENTTHSFIGYDLTRATYDASASVAQYHKVTVYPGVQSVDLSNGSTEYYYYNGIKSAESASPFPSATDDSYTKLLSGSMYRSNVLNNSGSLVAYSVSFSSVVPKTIFQGIGMAAVQVETGYYLRPIKTWQSATGTFPSLLTETNFEYNSNGLLLRKTDTDGGKTIQEDYKYWYEEYDPTLTRNILTPVIQTKRTVQGGLVTDCSVVKYKSWGTNNVPAPYQMYSWKRTGSANFSAWSLASNPSTDWRLVNTIDDMDTSKGLVKQTTAADGTVTKTIWDGAGKQVLAIAILPQNGHVIYNGFEECTANCSNEAKTGMKSSNGTALSFGGLPSNTYKVTYWQKPSVQSNWEYVETTFTGTSYSVPHTWIDELRIAPVSARIVSYAYDRYGNVISACDENNMITYKEYDEFNRPKLTRDQDGKIREFTVYNIRN